MNALKPCPFCGARPGIIPWHGAGPMRRMVSCDNEACPAMPQVVANTPAKAIALWNTRAAAPKPDKELARECEWTKYDADDCGYPNCWATSCGEDFSIVEEWHEEPTKYCSNCGGKVRPKVPDHE